MDQDEVKTTNTGEMKEQKAEELFRITVTREAEKALAEIVERVNQGFEGGKVNRTEMASWALSRLFQDLNESILQDIRSSFFDEVTALESLWRKAKERGYVSEDLKQLLMKEIGFDQTSKRPPKSRVDKELRQ